MTDHSTAKATPDGYAEARGLANLAVASFGKTPVPFTGAMSLDDGWELCSPKYLADIERALTEGRRAKDALRGIIGVAREGLGLVSTSVGDLPPSAVAPTTALCLAAENVIIHHGMGWEMEGVLKTLEVAWRALPKPTDLDPVCPCGRNDPHYHDGEHVIAGRWAWQAPGSPV